jgi:nitrate reductase NapAB chaperone NapD
MPVFSYLAYPALGAKEQLLKDLKALDHCEVMPAENEDVLILVTDTPDDEKEKELQKKLEGLKSLQSLGMAFGHTDE